MDFSSSPDNPVPEGAVRHTLQTADGTTLRAGIWRPKGAVRGTVCLLHGRAETTEKYYEVIGELMSRGFVVATLDWRGQGGSDRRLNDRRKGHVDDFDEYEQDLDAFLQQLVEPFCERPHFALAHSTGGLVCLRAARRAPPIFERMVLTAPLIDLGAMNPPLRFVRLTSGALAFCGLNDCYPPGAGLARLDERGFDGNPLTSDERRFRRTLAIGKTAPQLGLGAPTIGWLHAASRAMAEAARPAFAAAVKVPTLVVTAGADRVVSPLAIERMVREMRLGSQIVLRGSRHEILMERDAIRALFWAAFDAFIPGEPATDA